VEYIEFPFTGTCLRRGITFKINVHEYQRELKITQEQAMGLSDRDFRETFECLAVNAITEEWLNQWDNRPADDVLYDDYEPNQRLAA
jgi:hypothetical protein